MENLKVFIITEGSSNIGFGHITRMLSIYQAFEEKGIKPKFIINGDETILDLIKNTDYEIYNWIKEENRLLNEIKDADIAIIDSYLADKLLYEKISKIVKLPVYYDDNNRLEYPCGVVVNGNIHANELNYPKKDCITYLLGTQYLPLRKELWEVEEKVIKENIETVMVTFGGDDVRNMTPKVLNILTKHYPEIEKKVIIGKGFKNIKEIEEIADKNTELIYFPDAKKMKEVMLQSDVAISAAGQTLYELARTGTPTIAIAVAENQLGNLKGFEEKGFLISLGMWNAKNLEEKVLESVNKIKTNDERKKLSEIGKSFVDGKGSIKICNYLVGHENTFFN